MSRRRRGRTTALSFVATLLLLTLGLNIALDTVCPHWRDPEFGHRLFSLQRRLTKDSDKPLLVALGSSRTQMGLNPLAMKLESVQVYNFSQAGCGPPQQVMNLKRLLARGIVPKYLLVEILPPVLGNRGPLEKSFVVPRLSWADLQNVKHYFSTPEALTLEWLQLRVAPFHMCRQNLMSHLVPNWLPTNSRQDFLWTQIVGAGWAPYFHVTITDEARARGYHLASLQYQPYFIDFDLAPQELAAHQELIDLCQRHSIHVAFYTLPESVIFRSWYSARANAQLQNYFSDLTKKHGTPVFQCSDWLHDDGCFADGHHLMRHGAEAFSARFARECVDPWLVSTRR